MPSLHNPTGKGIHRDAAGDGHYGSPRGSRTHRGVDFLCSPGQNIEAPISGLVRRLAFPYASTQEYMGLVIQGKWCTVKIFYMEPMVKPGQNVVQTQFIGYAQDISKKYPGQGMFPHIHLEFKNIIPNPELYL